MNSPSSGCSTSCEENPPCRAIRQGEKKKEVYGKIEFHKATSSSP